MYEILILNGNSTNATFTLGALQKLFDSGVLNISEISEYYGTSSGSIICTLLSIGFEPIEILSNMCIKNCYSKVSGLNFQNISNGFLMSFEAIEKEIEEIIITKLGFIPTMKYIYEKFGKKLCFVTYNLTRSEKEIISHETYPDLPVNIAIRMSSTFPFVFKPFQFNDCFYIDGGLVDNFPVKSALNSNKKCFGLFTKTPSKKYSQDLNYLDYFLHLLGVFIDSAALHSDSENCRILNIPCHSISFFNFSSSKKELIKIFDSGYDICSENI